MTRKQGIFTLVFLILLGIIAAVAFYFYRYSNLPDRPLFYSTYGPPKHYFGPWDWQLDPPPLFAIGDKIILIDVPSNMLAIVKGNTSATAITTFGQPNAVLIGVGRKMIRVEKLPDKIIEVNSDGESVLATIRPNEASTIYARLSLLKGDPTKNVENEFDAIMLDLKDGHHVSN